jgi:signal peptidase II
VLEAGPDAPIEDDGAGASGDEAVGRAERAPRRWWLIGLASALVIVADQVTKWWARNELESPMHVIGSLRFNLAFNSGTAFPRVQGWRQDLAVPAVVLVAVPLRACRCVRAPRGALAMGLVLGGAVGNLIDRVVQPGDGILGGRVTDFIDLQWWPVFNIADAGITVGGIALVLLGLVGDAADASARRAEAGAAHRGPAAERRAVGREGGVEPER